MDVLALTTFDDGGGKALYAGGHFSSVGGVAANRVARWDGSSWSTLGSGLGGDFPGSSPLVAALAVFDDGGGPALYAGGQFSTAGGAPANHVARWDGSSWSALGSGTDDIVFALCVFDDGDGAALYAAGSFSTAGGVPASRIARWDGSAWSAVGTGMEGFWVGALTVFDDGSGPALVAAGSFDHAGGVPARSLAAWDGAGWAEVGGGLLGGPEVLAVFDDGSGPALYVGGAFTEVGDFPSVPAHCIARWDGSTWSALGSGVGGVTVPHVFAIVPHDDGGGPELFVGGRFATAGGLAASRIARWDGSAWSAVGGGVNLDVRAFAEFGRGPKRALFVGGSFDVSPTGDSFLARWGKKRLLRASPVGEIQSGF
jgi:hypothetical protein